DARLYERRAGTLQNLAGAPCFALAAWASIIGDVHKLVDVLTSKFTTMDREARLEATRRSSVRELIPGRLDVVTIEPTEGGTAACYRKVEAQMFALDDYQFLVVSTNDVDDDDLASETGSRSTTSLCQQCNLGDAEESDDAATFLPCSFCNLSYHNSAGCLGKAGGAILSEREAKNEEHEWACPPCWAGALAKARRATQGLVATRVVVGKKTSQKKSKKASKK
ncbi:hypothetical protein M885DRAFT_562571, partial [Pelagophyceae sp. CCMP2097]